MTDLAELPQHRGRLEQILVEKGWPGRLISWPEASENIDHFGLLASRQHLIDEMCRRREIPERTINLLLVDTEKVAATSVRLPDGARYVLLSAGAKTALTNLGCRLELRAAERGDLTVEQAAQSAWDVPQLQRDLAHLRTEMAIDFLVAHECGHHINGHLGLPPDDLTTSDGRLTSRALEYDADAFAAVELNRCVGHRMTRPGADYPGVDEWRFGMDQFAGAALTLWASSPEFFDFNLGRLDRKVHPPPYHRLISIMMVMTEIIETNGGLTGVLGRRQEMIADYCITWTKRVYESLNVNWSKTIDGRPSRKYTAAVVQRYAALYPHLLLTKLGNHKLAPPQDEPR